MHTWQFDSWQHKPHKQIIAYSSTDELQRVVNTLASLPPLVTRFEVDNLKNKLAAAARGECFLLQGGDCAESFSDCYDQAITNKLKILLQMSLVLIHGLRKPVIRVGRIAGQYAKPRSSDTETQGHLTLPSYRGDLINQAEFTAEARAFNPNHMLKAYYHSAATLNYIRGLAVGGFADLHQAKHWNLDFAQYSPMVHQYQTIANTICDALNFLDIIPGSNNVFLGGVDFYTSHEGLHLWYEQALTRQQADGKWYNLSTHFPWIGVRTSEVNEAHIEYFRGITNPIAIKLGPNTKPDKLTALIEKLNPSNEPGRLTLIHRLGHLDITTILPKLIFTVNNLKANVLWICDPMHGNTTTTEQGIKTRRFEDILLELEQAFRIHHECESILGGIHFEMTGENVTECLGGSRGLTEQDLSRAYKSLCDPRLNYEQALEIAMRIVANYV